MHPLRTLSAFALLCLLPGFAAAQAVNDGFDNGAGNWGVATVNTQLEYHGSGGNPGGYLLFYGSNQIGVATRSAPFIGDYAAAGYRQIAVDIYVSLFPLAGPKPDLFIRANASVANWSYKLTTFVPQAGSWQHFAVPIDASWSDAEAQAAGWVMGDGPAISFTDTLRHVYTTGLRMQYAVTHAAYLGVDNFSLSDQPAPPTPGQPAESSGNNQGSGTEQQAGTASSASQSGSSAPPASVQDRRIAPVQPRSGVHKLDRNLKRLPPRTPLPAPQPGQ